jgi:hypothetical protein
VVEKPKDRLNSILMSLAESDPDKLDLINQCLCEEIVHNRRRDAVTKENPGTGANLKNIHTPMGPNKYRHRGRDAGSWRPSPG